MPPVTTNWSEADAFIAEARERDAADPLAPFRDRFHMPPHGDGEVLYFTGNSLGLQPKQAATFIEGELEDWRTFGVEGHFHGRRPWVDSTTSPPRTWPCSSVPDRGRWWP